MTQILKIDFVSDISCPWCAIGLSALEQALANLNGSVAVELRFQPFEINPDMPAGGQDIGEHMAQKYGAAPEDQAQIRNMIGERGAALGFAFNTNGNGRIYNTFDAHRLLHWAGLESAPTQLALKKALLVACHGQLAAMESHEVLLNAVAQVGLDLSRARDILVSSEFADAVRERQAFYSNRGVYSVPAVIINDDHLISGGQPVAVFEQALQQIAAQQTCASIN